LRHTHYTRKRGQLQKTALSLLTCWLNSITPKRITPSAITPGPRIGATKKKTCRRPLLGYGMVVSKKLQRRQAKQRLSNVVRPLSGFYGSAQAIHLNPRCQERIAWDGLGSHIKPGIIEETAKHSFSTRLVSDTIAPPSQPSQAMSWHAKVFRLEQTIQDAFGHSVPQIGQHHSDAGLWVPFAFLFSNSW